MTRDGATVWAARRPEGGWSMVCRTVAGDQPGVIASADYHYIEGEEQRHFTAEER